MIQIKLTLKSVTEYFQSNSGYKKAKKEKQRKCQKRKFTSYNANHGTVHKLDIFVICQ